MTRLYVVRHGQTEWNKLNRTQGCGNDLSLSNIGISQAQSIACRLKNLAVDAIYSSDLKRAYETANEISKAHSIPVYVKQELREMNFGCWEGLTSEEIRLKYSDIYEVWRSNPRDTIIPEGETLILLQERVMQAANDILSKHTGKNIIIVSHGITIKIFLLSLLGMDISNHGKIRIDNASLNIIEYRDKTPVLTLFNDTCHLA